MARIDHWLNLLNEKAPAGYAMGFHMKFTAPKLMLQSYPTEWVNHYEDKGFFRVTQQSCGHSIIAVGAAGMI